MDRDFFLTTDIRMAFRELKEQFGLNMPREQVRINIRMFEKDPKNEIIVGALDMYDPSYRSGYSICLLPDEMLDDLVEKGLTDYSHKILVHVIQNCNNTEKMLKSLLYR